MTTPIHSGLPCDPDPLDVTEPTVAELAWMAATGRTPADLDGMPRSSLTAMETTQWYLGYDAGYDAALRDDPEPVSPVGGRAYLLVVVVVIITLIAWELTHE